MQLDAFIAACVRVTGTGVLACMHEELSTPMHGMHMCVTIIIHVSAIFGMGCVVNRRSGYRREGGGRGRGVENIF